MLNGIEDITTSSLSDRVTLFNRDSSLKFGPLEAGDQAVLVGCRVLTGEYGQLPSPLATISVLSECMYKC